MLSLQDSVFFEISIKSLLKSWSSSCEYLAELPVVFTYLSRPPDLSAARSATAPACSPVDARRVPISSPGGGKVNINGVARIERWSRFFPGPASMCTQLADVQVFPLLIVPLALWPLMDRC